MGSLSGCVVLVVEDEGLVALLVADTLKDAGARVLGSASSVRSALRFVELGVPDVVVLDVNLGGELSTPVAAELRRRDIPFVVTTGYAEDALEGPHRGGAVLTKPYEPEALVKAVGAATAGTLPRRSLR